MPRKPQKLTVRQWVPDANCPGGYRPLESLSPDKLAAFRRRNAERIAAVFQQCVNERPERLNLLPEN